MWAQHQPLHPVMLHHYRTKACALTHAHACSLILVASAYLTHRNVLLGCLLYAVCWAACCVLCGSWLCVCGHGCSCACRQEIFARLLCLASSPRYDRGRACSSHVIQHVLVLAHTLICPTSIHRQMATLGAQTGLLRTCSDILCLCIIPIGICQYNSHQETVNTTPFQHFPTTSVRVPCYLPPCLYVT